MFFKSLLVCFILLTTFGKANTAYTISDGNWENATTWHNGVIPTNQDSIIITHYVVINTNKTLASPTVLFISSTGTICGDYLLETLCGAKFINYGFMFLNQIKTKLGSNYNTIKCKSFMIISGCSPSVAGFNSYPPNGNVTVWPPVLCQTIDTNWEGGTSIGMIELENNNIRLYPNPLQYEPLQVITLSSSSIKLRDVLGKELKTAKFDNKTEIDFSTLPSGVYFLEIEIDEKPLVKKIVKLD